MGLHVQDSGLPLEDSDWEGPWELLGAGYIPFHDLVGHMKIL